MQVTETKNEGLMRGFKILVPADHIESRVTDRLAQLSGSVRIPGFRPGKVPPSLMRKRYGPAVMGEVLEQAVNETSGSVMSERGLRAAAQPKVEITSFDEGKDLEYTMEVEVLPEIPAMDFAKIKLERLVAEASEEDIAKTLERIAHAHQDSKPISSKRKSKKGDVVVIDFAGRIDDKDLPGGKADGYHLELGSDSFIPGFEDNLIGVAAGSDVSFDIEFPADYGAAELAGKKATFDVKLQEIREPSPAAMDDELAKKVGMESMELLKKTLKEEHEREYKSMSRQHLKRNLLDVLADHFDFAVPGSMVDREFDAIWSQYEESRKAGMDEDEEDKSKSEDEKKGEFRALAERRVRLGLVLGDIGRVNSVQVSPEEISRAVYEEARRYPGHEKEVVDFLKRNPAAMEQLTAPLYEDKVVDFILEMAEVSERKVGVDDLVKANDDAGAPVQSKAKTKAKKPKAAAPNKAKAKKSEDTETEAE